MESLDAAGLSDAAIVSRTRGSAGPQPRRIDGAGQGSPRRRAWRAIACALMLAGTASLFAACDGGGGGGGSSAEVEYFPAGGVSESMSRDRPDARLSLDHTVVTWLEAAGTHDGDVGSDDGVDEFMYHFKKPTRIRLSLDQFDEAPELIALDASGNEVAHVTADSGDIEFTASGEHTFRLVHPHAGDTTATPIPIFLHPIMPEEASAEADGGPAQANPNDIATLKASKSCPSCNLAGMSWNACPGGVTLTNADISHADFTGANLACVNFHGGQMGPLFLTGAIFNDASLNEVTFTGVELSDAHFSGTAFEITTFDRLFANGADFSGSTWSNSTFGGVDTSGTFATNANFRGVQFKAGSCLSVLDLRNADFTGASFAANSSVYGTWFAGANLFDVTFNGTKFHYDDSLPHCGAPPGACGVNCVGDLGCKAFAGVMECVQNQGAVTLSSPAVCQRPTDQETPKGVMIEGADLTGATFAGADLTNSVFASNTLDHTTDFTGTVLDGVDFSMEHLGRGVDLSHAMLSDTTNFAGAGLTDFPNSQQGVNLSCVTNGDTKTGGCSFPAQTTQFMGASMQYAQLLEVGLTEANLEKTVLDDANLVGAKLNFANLKGASLVGAHLGVDPGMSGAATMSGAYAINADLTDADMRSVDFTGAHLYGAAKDALFVRTLLDAADFTNAILDGAVFTNANLPAAVFNGAQLVNASFDGATLSNAKFDSAYLQGADFSTAKAVQGMVLSNAAVSTTLTSANCTLIAPGSWMYMDQDGVPYTYAFDATMLKTDATVTCPDGLAGPCNTGDSLCPLMSGPFPPIPPCVPSEQYCYENCLKPPCFKDVPDPQTHLCPATSNCM